MKKNLLLMSLLTIFGLLPAMAKSPVKNVQPGNWWAGMTDPTLQIIIYGENLAYNPVTIDSKDIKIKDVVFQDNPNYVILYLDTEGAAAQKFNINIKKGRKNITIPYELKERRPDARLKNTFTSADVMYLLMPDRFANGDESNDIVERLYDKQLDRDEQFGRHGGDLKGMTEHLDYLQDLGVTCIWTTPVIENNMKSQSYHGYAFTDYYKIDERLGTNEDYRNFVSEAHKHGLKVVMDLVFNHCGSENYLFKDMPSDDWFHYGKNYVQTSYKTASMMDPHAAKIESELATDGWFVECMPDWNQRNPHVARYLIQTALWWTEYADIDGIRQDTHPYADYDMMAAWCKSMDREYPGFNIVGEVWINSNTQVAYWQKDSKLAYPRNSYLPTVMDFPLMYAMNRAFDEETSDWEGGLYRLWDLLSQDFVYADTNNLLIFLDNHDTSRYASNKEKAENLDRYKQALAFMLTTRGIPQIYYGTELLMYADKVEGDGNLRRDFPGGWKDDAVNMFTEEGRTGKVKEAHDYMKKLLNWRKNCKAAQVGRLTHYAPHDGFYVYSREYEGKEILVILNGSDKPATIDFARYKEIIPSAEGYDIITGRTVCLDGRQEMEARAVRIVEL